MADALVAAEQHAIRVELGLALGLLGAARAHMNMHVNIHVTSSARVRLSVRRATQAG